ncbi:MAG: hypothetical protein CM15mP22_6390 [Gammaproteobacteria bacterium]|nr:MAG: hypothetical protein CM15mP22_6390 [Gammaproteobacteria bacterium]
MLPYENHFFISDILLESIPPTAIFILPAFIFLLIKSISMVPFKLFLVFDSKTGPKENMKTTHDLFLIVEDDHLCNLDQLA